MKKLVYGFWIFCVFLMANPGSARAYSYSEDFTATDFDLANSNWNQLFDGEWTDTPGGPLNIIASGDGDYSVAGISLDSPDLHSTGIEVSTIFTNYGADSSAGIFIGLTPNKPEPSTPEDYDVLTVSIEHDTDDEFQGMQLRVSYSDGTSHDYTCALDGADIDMKFQLIVNIDYNNLLTWELDQIEGDFSASDSVTLERALTGKTGVFAEISGADFYKFEVSENAVPIPGALLLMGSGLLAVFGMRRRQQ